MSNIDGDIQNRPKELWAFPNYSCLPDESFQIDLAGAAGEFLANDIFDLDGIQPLESAVMKLSNEFFEGVPVIHVNPSKEAIDLYKDRGDTFQMINVVVCCHSFERRNGKLYGLPYHVSLYPAQKKGVPAEVNAEWIENIDLENALDGQSQYIGYNPFSKAFGIYAGGGMPVSKSTCSDTIGFVYNTYFLSSNYVKSDVCDPGLCTSLLGDSKGMTGDYRKFRFSRYFKRFKSVAPIKVWGCDSPIELFLLQAMSQLGLNPKIQMLIYPDGSVFPSLQSMWEGGIRTSRLSKIITEADFFFENEKIAIFCDSVAHHTSAEDKAKDSTIDDKLNKIGIRSYRVSGKDIAESPVGCAARIKEFMNS